jgi:hypothetical protein
MRYPILLSALAAAVLAAPGPAVRADAKGPDLLFPRREATTVTARAAGQPFWALLAECAGVFGAASNYETARGDSAAAEEDARIGTQMADEAIRRLMQDRGLDHDAALAYAGAEINVGRSQGQELLAGGDRGAFSAWNSKRSACLDIDQVYARYRGR